VKPLPIFDCQLPIEAIFDFRFLILDCRFVWHHRHYFNRLLADEEYEISRCQIFNQKPAIENQKWLQSAIGNGVEYAYR